MTAGLPVAKARSITGLSTISSYSREIGDSMPDQSPSIQPATQIDPLEAGQASDFTDARTAPVAAERSLHTTGAEGPSGISWRSSGPPARWQTAMAYDSARGVVVLFGGNDGIRLNDTWEWDGTSWMLRHPAAQPSARHAHAMAYDAARGVVVLFGGDDGSDRNDTWEWDGANWTLRSPSSQPAARDMHAMAYDSARGVVVLFGGYGSGRRDDTWEWDGSNWTARSPTTRPAARQCHSMAYDSTRGVVVLFGGYDGGDLRDDTWEWDGTNWTQKNPPSHPSARQASAMGYDSARAVVVLFGGSASGGALKDDTWEWNGTSWVERSPANPPTARYRHAMAYDSARDVVVLFGGYGGGRLASDSWEWNGTDWLERRSGSRPWPRYSHAMSYDDARDRIVLYGGRGSNPTYKGDTWEWDGTSWIELDPTNSPSALANHAMAYDSVRGVVVLNGGTNGTGSVNNTWEWNGVNWIQRQPATYIPARQWHAMAYDSARAVVVLFGGGYTMDDTWEWDGTDWQERNPANRPAGRYSHAMAYDSARGVVVLFGGSVSSGVTNDTWEWDGTNWVRRYPATLPPARSGHAMAYDRARGVTILFGGSDSTNRLNDTWEWDGTNWVQIAATVSPSARSSHAMAYNGPRGVLLFGGYGADPLYKDDTWSYAPPLWSPTLLPIDNTDGNGDYLVDWTDVAAATSYILEEDDDPTFASAALVHTGAGSEYTRTGQTTGLWYYRVSAVNDEGQSCWSNVESAGVVPAPPLLLPIANGDGDGDYSVDWNAVTGADVYILEEDDNGAFSSSSVLYSGASTEYQIDGHAGGTWYYRVKASNEGGDSPWSNTESTTVTPNAPSLLPIDNLDGDGSYLVDWDAAQGATEYTLEEDDNPNFTSPTVRYQDTGTQHQVTGQYAGTWYYRVLASNTAGDSPWSNVQSANVVPGVPLLYAIDNPSGNTSYLVDWNAVQGATGYTLEEDDNAGFTSPGVRYQGTASQFLIVGQEGGTWHYRVRASNAGGSSAWSNVEATTVRPDAPILYPINNNDGNGDYLVDWSTPQGVTSYTLQADADLAFSAPVTVYQGTISQYSVADQPVGVWYYRAAARNVGGDSDWSNVESVNVLPEAPFLSAISNPDWDGDYTVSWNPVDGSTGYLLQEDQDPDFPSPVARCGGTATFCDITGQPDGTWYYHVQATSAGGNSAWSNIESTTVDTTPPASTASAPDYGRLATVAVGWTAFDPASSSGLLRTCLWFKLETTGAWTDTALCDTTSSGTFSFSPPGGTNGIYYFQTVAEDNAGNVEAGPAGDGDDSTLYDTVVPASTAMSPVYDNAGTIAVDWTASDTTSGVAGTQLYVRSHTGSWVDSGLAPQAGTSGTFYYTPTAGDGIYYFQSVSTDHAGNQETAPSGSAGMGDTQTIYDTTAPASAASSPSCANSVPISVTWAAADATAGVSHTVLYVRAGESAWASAGLALQPGYSGTFLYAPAGDGTYYFQSVSTDQAGNQETVPSGTTGTGDDVTVYDTIDPASMATSPAFATGASIPVDWTASDPAPASGIQQTCLWYRLGPGAWTSAGLCDAGTVGTFNFQPPGGTNGTYYFQTVARDHAGNVEPGPSGSGDTSTGYDTLRPSSHCTSPAYDNAGTIRVDWTAAAASGARLLSPLDHTRLWARYGDGAWASTTLAGAGTSGSFDYLPTHGEGTYAFATQACDAAGNCQAEPAGEGDTHTLYDTLPPASQAGSPAQVSPGSNIPVSWNASDATSGVESTCLWYRFGTTGSWTAAGDCRAGTSGTMPFTPARGAGTFYFQTIAADRAGNLEPGPAGDGDTHTIVQSAQHAVYLPLVTRALFTDPYEPNDTFEQAWGPLASDRTYRAYFPTEADANDFYYLDLPAAHSLDISLTGILPGNDHALYLYDAAHVLIAYSDEYGTADEHIYQASLPAGRYYVRVERFQGTTPPGQPYALRVVYAGP